MVNHAHKIDFHVVANETEALQLEDNLIKQHKPPYNRLLKDNNRYVYIKITNEQFPQIFIVKQRKNDKATYIGPKYHSKDLKKFLQYFRQLLGYRSCKATQFRQWKLCSDYYFGLCKGRCVYNSHNQQITTKTNSSRWDFLKIKNFFRWETKPIEKEIRKQIQKSIQLQHFERAAKLRDMLLSINQLSEHQRVILDPNLHGHFIKLIQLGPRWIFCVLHFYQGKLIDIITDKHSTHNTDIHSITTIIQSEFWNSISFITPTQSSSPIISNIAEKSQNKQPQTKESTQSKIQTLTDTFLDNYIAKTSFQKENLITEILSQLQTRYQLQNFPYHIECIDISHFGGKQNSGGLSCFVWGIPHKSWYRHYKLPDHKDDYSSLEEIIIRRFQHTDNLPDLFILDGWLGQINIITKLLKHDRFQPIFQQVDFISIWKWAARKTAWKLSWAKEIVYSLYHCKITSHSKLISESPNHPTFPHHSKLDAKSFKNRATPLTYDQTDRILIQIRNEAHRFANSYRKKQMSQKH